MQIRISVIAQIHVMHSALCSVGTRIIFGTGRGDRVYVTT